MNGKETWYVRDASGTILSIYTKGDAAINSGHLTQSELDLYGSSRLGITQPNLDVSQSIALNNGNGSQYFITFTRGKKFFELTNHLGNVLATISDRKLPVAKTNNANLVDYYLAHVVSATDYYPGGMQMVGRTYSATSYRYGFNGKEIDNETYGQGNEYDFGDRIYNPRIGRWFSIDPLQQKYPAFSPYNFAINNPLNVIDPDGKDIILLTWVTKKGDPGHTAIAIQDYKAVQVKVNGKTTTVMKPTNTYTIYEFGPGTRLLAPEQATKNTTSWSPVHQHITKEQLMANKGSDGKRISEYDANAPDGVIEFKTDYKIDKPAIDKMDAKVDDDMLAYNGVYYNCTTYCSDIIPTSPGETIDATEMVDINGKKYKTQTPNKLYKAAEKLKNATLLKKAPEELVNKGFEQAYYGQNDSPKKDKKN